MSNKESYIKRITDMIEAYESAYDSLSILLRYAHIMDLAGNKCREYNQEYMEYNQEYMEYNQEYMEYNQEYMEYNLKDLEALEAILEAPLKDITRLTNEYDKDIDEAYNW